MSHLKPGISFTTIVKNEEKNLPRLLESIIGVVDEIVIVDTGSTDRTIEIARAAGAKVVEIEWPREYDAARNVGLEYVEHEWILVLDGDEWLAEESRELIREIIQKPEVGAYFLYRRDLIDDTNFTEMRMIRLFKNHPDIKFKGIIHEQILPTEVERVFGAQPVQSEVRFWHDGYQFEYSEEKALGQVDYLEREIARNPDSIYHKTILIAILNRANIPSWKPLQRQVVQYCFDHEGEPFAPEMSLSTCLALELLSVRDLDLNSERTKRVMGLTWKWFGDLPLAVFALSRIALRQKDLHISYLSLERLVEMAQTGSYAKYGTFDIDLIFGPQTFMEFSIAATHKGDIEGAKRALRKLLNDPTYGATAVERLSVLEA